MFRLKAKSDRQCPNSDQGSEFGNLLLAIIWWARRCPRVLNRSPSRPLAHQKDAPGSDSQIEMASLCVLEFPAMTQCSGV
ncbi:uncharacterized protein METZ01_LOCUS64054 [marine metagenome]|uniref:Uncharacterized protein n=1 Tax=marine metagenome TaxID=408172 RepID=A0A381T4T9_9ZZZZ